MSTSATFAVAPFPVVTWVDTPGVALPSKSEPIDFIVLGEAFSISVSFPDGIVEERAYREGAFVSPYLDSTQVGSTFSLKRTGGWPAAPTVHVDTDMTPTELDEVDMPDGTVTGPASSTVGNVALWNDTEGTELGEGPAVTSLASVAYVDAAVLSAGGWRTYCDFNFTQMANRTISADGDLTIDGITMTAGNATTGNSTIAIVAGTGLRISAASTTNTYWYHSGHLSTWLGIDMSRITGWLLESSEARVYAEWYLTTGTANYATASFGFTKRLNFLSNDWSPMIRQVYAGGIARDVHYIYAATEDARGFNNAFNVGMVHYRSQYNLSFYGKTFSGADTDPNSAAFADVASMTLLGRQTEARTLGAGPRVNSPDAMMAFMTGQNGNTVGNTVCTFKRLRLEYKL